MPWTLYEGRALLQLEPTTISDEIKNLYVPLNLSVGERGEFAIVKKNDLTILIQRVHYVFSDSDYEKIANAEFVQNARGDVLIGGLGLGYIVLAIQDKPEVHSIKVVEISEDVIDLVAYQSPFNDKVQIINQNIFEYEPNQKFDTLYIDISGMSSERARNLFLAKFEAHKRDKTSYIDGRIEPI